MINYYLSSPLPLPLLPYTCTLPSTLLLPLCSPFVVWSKLPEAKWALICSAHSNLDPPSSTLYTIRSSIFQSASCQMILWGVWKRGEVGWGVKRRKKGTISGWEWEVEWERWKQENSCEDTQCHHNQEHKHDSYANGCLEGYCITPTHEPSPQSIKFRS